MYFASDFENVILYSLPSFMTAQALSALHPLVEQLYDIVFPLFGGWLTLVAIYIEWHLRVPQSHGQTRVVYQMESLDFWIRILLC